MSEAKIKKMIAETFLEVADALETGRYGKKAVIGFACEGSEHGQENTQQTSTPSLPTEVWIFLYLFLK